MTTKLEKELRREIMIDGEPHTVSITPTRVKLTKKGKRSGFEIEWKDVAVSMKSNTDRGFK